VQHGAGPTIEPKQRSARGRDIAPADWQRFGAHNKVKSKKKGKMKYKKP
jgi:hypothetical protein